MAYHGWVYWPTYGLSWVICRLLFRLRVHGARHVPRRGPCLLAVNHASYVDPVVLGAALQRPIRFIARHELFSMGFLGRWIRALGAIPVNIARPETATFKAAITLLRQGWVVALFPEGGRAMDDALQVGKPGAGWLAAKVRVPVIPVYLQGTRRALPRGSRRLRCARIQVWFGPPMDPSALAQAAQHKRYAEVAQVVMDAIGALKRQAEHRKGLAK